MKEEQRRFYRIAYTTENAPISIFNGVRIHILSISEKACRFTVESGGRFQSGDAISGTINFLDGHSETVQGAISRQIGEQYVAVFSTPIPLVEILNEERFLADYTLKLHSEPGSANELPGRVSGKLNAE